MYKNLTIVALIALFFPGQVSADSHVDPDFNDDGIVNLADYAELLCSLGNARRGLKLGSKVRSARRWGHQLRGLHNLKVLLGQDISSDTERARGIGGSIQCGGWRKLDE